MHYMRDIDCLIESLKRLKGGFAEDFSRFVDDVVGLDGNVIAAGIGKSGAIASKFSSTLCSVGVRSFFVHPVEAVHGDLGRISPNDVCVIISHSGNSIELKGLISYCKACSIPICAITGNLDSYLRQNASYVLNYEIEEEICPLNLAPTVSTTLALTICDLIAVQAMRASGFSEADFRKYHPGGSLGHALESVESIALPLEALPAVDLTANPELILSKLNSTKFGVLVVENSRGIQGIITDGDYRRFLQTGESFAMSDVMNPNPISIDSRAVIKDVRTEFATKNLNIIFISEDEELTGFVHVSQMAGI